MLRRAIIMFFILINLMLQVSSAYACELLDGLVAAKCCCLHDALHDICSANDHCPASGLSQQDPCCSRVIVPETKFISEASGPVDYQKTWSVPLPSLTIIFDSSYLGRLQASEQRFVDAAESFLIYPGLPLYLTTERLRI